MPKDKAKWASVDERFGVPWTEIEGRLIVKLDAMSLGDQYKFVKKAEVLELIREFFRPSVDSLKIVEVSELLKDFSKIDAFITE